MSGIARLRRLTSCEVVREGNGEGECEGGRERGRVLG